MSRYIDAERLLFEMKHFCEGNCKRCKNSTFLSKDEHCGLIDNIPTADVVEVVHASWEQTTLYDDDNNALFICTNCGAGDKHAKGVIVPYCWNCGAKMGKKAE